MPRRVRHLRDATVTALADGQLCPRSTERALGHVAACAPCHDRLESERLARRALASVQEVPPNPDFTARLIASCPAMAQRTSPESVVPPAHPWSVRPHLRGRVVTWSVAGVAATGVAVVGGLFAIGGQPRDLVWAEVTPDARSSLAVVSRAALPASSSEHSAWAEDRAPRGDPAPGGDAAPDGDATAQALRWMRAEGWVVPEFVPADLAVVDVSADPDGPLVVVLEGAGARVVITEHRGRLDDDAEGLGEPVVLGHVTARLVQTSPWTAVVETADTVVTVVSHGSDHAGRQVAAALTGEPAPLDAAGRVARGWAIVVDFLDEPTR